MSAIELYRQYNLDIFTNPYTFLDAINIPAHQQGVVISQAVSWARIKARVMNPANQINISPVVIGHADDVEDACLGNNNKYFNELVKL